MCGRNNQVSTKPITFSYDTTEDVDFQFINDNNQIQTITDLSGFALAVGLKQNNPSYDLLALSRDFEVIDGNLLRFHVNTYTTNWLKHVNKNNTEANLEISQDLLNGKKVLLRDYCFVWPRTLIDGLTPEEIASNNYYTKSETQEVIDEAISEIGISGYVTDEEFLAGLETKQDVIDAENKLDYGLLSGTPTIPTKTSDLDNDSDFVDSQYVTDATSAFITEDALQGYATEQYVDTAVSGKADKDEIPTDVSELNNDAGYITNSALEGYATEQYVNAEVSGKQDEINYDNPLDAHNVIMEFTDWQGDPEFRVDDGMNSLHILIQENTAAITGKADIADIPLSTSQLTNDSGFITNAALQGLATEQYVDAEVSGKQDIINDGNLLDAHYVTTELDPWQGDPQFTVDNAINEVLGIALDAQSGLSGKQDKITSTAKLDYGLLSGTPTIPTKTSDLNNDSGFITDAALVDYQEKITAQNKLDYALLSGVPADPNPVNVTLEIKNTLSSGVFVADFTGKQIQKYNAQDAVSGTISIDVEAFTSTATDIAPTIELQVPINGDVSTITLPASMNVVDIPATLTYGGSGIQYEDFVLRAEKDMNGTWQYYINHAYSFVEEAE